MRKDLYRLSSMDGKMEMPIPGPRLTEDFYTHSGPAGLSQDTAPVVRIPDKGSVARRAVTHYTQVLQSILQLRQKPQSIRGVFSEPYLVTPPRSPQGLRVNLGSLF